MMATAAELARIMPKPKESSRHSHGMEIQKSSRPSQYNAPLYGKRSGWIPHGNADYGDGGAYPEINVVQYPLDMGRRSERSKAGNSLALQVDERGKVNYNVIARQGHGNDRIVHSQFRDLVPLRERADVGEISLEKPSEDEIAETAERTKLALEKLVSGQLSATQPKNVQIQRDRDPKFIRYTPANQMGESADVQHNQRIIKMVNVQKDPMEPPKFRHKKIPRPPPSPPPPIMHSPPRRVSGKEARDWRIPPAVSNWKNPKGYTIPLDKRLAADGRDLQDIQINDRFATLSEALYTADRHAREEVRQRGAMQQKVARKQKEEKEEHLRQLAQRAREARMNEREPETDKSDRRARSEEEGPDHQSSEEEDDTEAVHRREALRRERRQELEREMRLNRMGHEQRMKVMAKEQGRDISEKIALGLAKPTQNKETMYDARLFNQSGGLDSGFKPDDAYDVYDQPWNQSVAEHIYRPSASVMDDVEDTNEGERAMDEISRNDRFSVLGKSTMKSVAAGAHGERTGPVLFEKDNDDVFGTEAFLASINPEQTDGTSKDGISVSDNNTLDNTIGTSDDRSKRRRI